MEPKRKKLITDELSRLQKELGELDKLPPWERQKKSDEIKAFLKRLSDELEIISMKENTFGQQF